MMFYKEKKSISSFTHKLNLSSSIYLLFEVLFSYLYENATCIPECLWFRYKRQFFNHLFFLFILSVCPVQSYRFQSSFHFQRLCKLELPCQLRSFNVPISRAEKENAEVVFSAANLNVSGTILAALRPASIPHPAVLTTIHLLAQLQQPHKRYLSGMASRPSQIQRMAIV